MTYIYQKATLPVVYTYMYNINAFDYKQCY